MDTNENSYSKSGAMYDEKGRYIKPVDVSIPSFDEVLDAFEEQRPSEFGRFTDADYTRIVRGGGDL